MKFLKGSSEFKRNIVSQRSFVNITKANKIYKVFITDVYRVHMKKYQKMPSLPKYD